MFFDGIDSGTLTLGTVFTASDNTAATAIAGMFANLADGSTFTIGSDAFRPPTREAMTITPGWLARRGWNIDGCAMIARRRSPD